MAIEKRSKNEIIFVFDQILDAKSVYLVGDFNEWDPKARRMVKARDGTFRAKMKLSPGDHAYKFVVDGIWLADPSCEQYPNAFGTTNSIARVA